MNRYQIRQEVRRLLRDDNYPKVDIDAAINSVIDTLNTMGRFKFHQGHQDVTLVAATVSYTITIQAEELVVFKPLTSDQVVLKKPPGIIDPFAEGWFQDTGDKPEYYMLRNDTIWFEPVPNATAAGSVVRVYSHRDVARLTGDQATPTIPARFHGPVLAYGAAAELNPTLVVEAGPRTVTIAQRAAQNLRAMLEDQAFEALIAPSIQLDVRWRGRLSGLGPVGNVRN